MAFDGTEGEQITLNEASALTADYRKKNPNCVLGQFIGKEMLTNILSQSGCVGIRIYHGINNKGKRELVLVGVDASENDIVTGIIADRMVGSPPRTGALNALNS